MDAVTIPLPIIHQLNEIHKNKNENVGNPGFQFDEPLILYFKPPYHKSSTTFQRTNTLLSGDDDVDDDDDDDEKSSKTSSLSRDSGDYNNCLVLNNIIPYVPSSSLSKDEIAIDTNSSNVISLHPLIEEFVIAWCDIVVRKEEEEEKERATTATETETVAAGVSGYLEYFHPPQYYNMNQQLLVHHGENDDNTGQNDDKLLSWASYVNENDELLLQRKVSRRKVYIQTQSNVYDIHTTLFSPTEDDKQQQQEYKISLFELNVDLQYIFCSHEGYEELIRSLSSSPSKTLQQQQALKQNTKNEVKNPTNQYLHQVLHQQLEFKTIKKSMILPIQLPPYPHIHPDNYCNQQDEKIVAFFKVDNFSWKIRRNKEHSHDVINVEELQAFLDSKNIEMSRDSDACYKIGLINDYDEIDDEDFIGDFEHQSSSDKNSLNLALRISSLAENIEGDNSNEVKRYTEHKVIEKGNKCTSPGYSKLVNEVSSLAKIPIESAAPTAVLMVGCAGVGKSRLASAVADELRHELSIVKTISAKDILLQASSSILDIDVLKNMIIPRNVDLNHKQYVLIIDDLDSLLDLDNDGTSSTYLFDERRAALHAILESIDDLFQQRKKSGSTLRSGGDRIKKLHSSIPFIFGICCAEQNNIPSSLNRFGRFEKIIEMTPPTEGQRQEMLSSMLYQLPICEIRCDNLSDGDEGIATSKEKQIDMWSKALARTTPGCVASDLNKICMDALTRSSSRSRTNHVTDNDDVSNSDYDTSMVSWEDLSEAARSCIPSQLAQLDVTIPRDDTLSSNQFVLTNDISGTKQKFEHSWNSFSGYSSMKSDLYRTVYKPWCRRHHSSEDNIEMSKLEMEVPPPSGILFHGPSGTGKTYAVDCLAMSLGLNMIKIRASDILDQWLGGSEAAIRSIFSRSRSSSPCLLLFDELDALATNREANDNDGGSSSDVYSRLLSTLLNEMDGVNSDSGSSNNALLVVGTTNRIHAIDPALLRPGRFEKHVHLQKPSIADVQAIMNKYLRKVPIGEDVDLVDLAEVLEELDASGADIQGICRESCLIAMRNIANYDDIDNVSLCKKDFEESIQMWKKG